MALFQPDVRYLTVVTVSGIENWRSIVSLTESLDKLFDDFEITRNVEIPANNEIFANFFVFKKVLDSRQLVLLDFVVEFGLKFTPKNPHYLGLQMRCKNMENFLRIDVSKSQENENLRMHCGVGTQIVLKIRRHFVEQFKLAFVEQNQVSVLGVSGFFDEYGFELVDLRVNCNCEDLHRT